jgi:hypothetical protein
MSGYDFRKGQGRHLEQFAVQGVLKFVRIVLRDVADRPGFGNEALISRSFDGLEEIIEDVGKALRFEPVDIVEVDADDGAIGRDFVALLDDRDKVLDHDPPRLRIVEIDRALGIAPSISRRLGRRKSTAIVSDIAISSDMVEDQIDARFHRRYRILGIDVEPSRFAARDGLIEALQQAGIDGVGQARCPILFFRLRGRAG